MDEGASAADLNGLKRRLLVRALNDPYVSGAIRARRMGDFATDEEMLYQLALALSDQCGRLAARLAEAESGRSVSMQSDDADGG